MRIPRGFNFQEGWDLAQIGKIPLGSLPQRIVDGMPLQRLQDIESLQVELAERWRLDTAKPDSDGKVEITIGGGFLSRREKLLLQDVETWQLENAESVSSPLSLMAHIYFLNEKEIRKRAPETAFHQFFAVAMMKYIDQSTVGEFARYYSYVAESLVDYLTVALTGEADLKAAEPLMIALKRYQRTVLDRELAKYREKERKQLQKLSNRKVTPEHEAFFIREAKRLKSERPSLKDWTIAGRIRDLLSAAISEQKAGGKPVTQRTIFDFLREHPDRWQ